MATPETAVALYNYEAFMGGESDFMAFRSKLPVGPPAPTSPPLPWTTETRFSYGTTVKSEP